MVFVCHVCGSTIRSNNLKIFKQTINEIMMSNGHHNFSYAPEVVEFALFKTFLHNLSSVFLLQVQFQGI